MLLSRAALLIACALTAACGFAPVYGPGGIGSGLRGSFHVQEPDNRNEFTFAGRVRERLGRGEAAPLLLNYRIDTRAQGVGVTPAQETTRYNIFGTVRYTVIDRATGRKITEGSVDNFTGYSATSLIVSTETVTRDANERLMVALANQVVARLIATAPEWRQ